jgi:hypothetical protein
MSWTLLIVGILMGAHALAGFKIRGDLGVAAYIWLIGQVVIPIAFIAGAVVLEVTR